MKVTITIGQLRAALWSCAVNAITNTYDASEETAIEEAVKAEVANLRAVLNIKQPVKAKVKGKKK